MTDPITWISGILVVIVVALALWLVFQRRRPAIPEDDYTKALELWLAGDLDGARSRFRSAIAKNPSVVDPYLQLGNLLRQTGDPRRAALLHRSLTVRRDIPRTQRVSIALSLAEDLLTLKQWQEAGEVLDTMKSLATTAARYWRARFTQWVGLGDAAEAARTLRLAAQACPAPDGPAFREWFGFYQADRALVEARAGNGAEARKLLREIPPESRAAAKSNYLRALLAAQEGDTQKAVATATTGLIEAPEEMVLFLPTLQKALLESGHFTRSLPILESACQSETAPPELWMALALLYEKLDRRDDAIGLLELKQPDQRLTPNIAAPYLKLLAAEEPHTAFARVWQGLHLPTPAMLQWRCARCGAKQTGVRWFCPACHGFDTYTVDRRREVTAGVNT